MGKPASFVFRDENAAAGYDRLSICDPDKHAQAKDTAKAISLCINSAHTTISNDYAQVTAAYEAVTKDVLRAIAPGVKR